MASPEFHVKTGASTWKVINNVYIKTAASTWKQVQNAYIKTAASTWKKFYQSVVWGLTNSSVTSNALNPQTGVGYWAIGGNTTSGYTKGYMSKFGGALGDPISWTNAHAWRTPTSGWGTLYVRLTDVGSNAPTNSSHAINGSTWHTLTEGSTNIWWNYQNSGTLPKSCQVLVEIATDSGGSNIVDSATYTITAFADF